MKSFGLGRYGLSGGVAVALLAACSGAQLPIGAPGAMPQSRAIATHTNRGGSWMSQRNAAGPFLYVGGPVTSMYKLGSTEPLHSTPENNYVDGAAIALDQHGDLCESTGDISFQQTYAYNARTLKLVGVLDGMSFPAIVADRSGYLYASSGGPRIYVYAPGCTRKVNVIHRCASVTSPLVFDRSGNLYAGNEGGWICVYAPTQKPGNMTFVRKIHEGISEPVALAIRPSGELYVASDVNASSGNFVSVFPRGASQPDRRITKGLAVPETLAVDSKGRLYVANVDLTHPPTAGSPSTQREARDRCAGSSTECIGQWRSQSTHRMTST